MPRFRLSLLAACLAVPAVAGANDDIRALRDELARMRDTYEQRIDALEKRLRLAEVAADKTTEAASPARPPAAAGPRAAAPRTAPAANAFNPEISAVLSGSYTKQSRNPASYNDENNQNPSNYHIHGFVPTLGEVTPPRKGFGLGESELIVAGNVDPHWRAQLTFALPGEGAEVEEAFVQSLGLDHGKTLKAGRFLSGIGYLNGRHAHTWDFADAPLVYKAFLANQLRADGVQLKWVAPTELFLELGGEVASGGPFPSTDKNKSGTTLSSLFAHVGGDIGMSQSWRAGLSALATSPRDREWRDVDSTGTAVQNRFNGKSRMWIADGIWKWAPGGNSAERALTVQAEYFRRTESGEMTYNFGDATGALAGPQRGGYATRQSGGYAQTVYQFRPAWRVGYRYDRLNSGSFANALAAQGVAGLGAADFPLLSAHKPTRHTAMLDHNTSEFARVRFQFSRDNVRYDFANRQVLADNQVWVQYIVSLGAHGAHRY